MACQLHTRWRSTAARFAVWPGPGWLTPAEVQEPRSSASPWGQAGPHSTPGPRGSLRRRLKNPARHSTYAAVHRRIHDFRTACALTLRVIKIPYRLHREEWMGGWAGCSLSRGLWRILWTSLATSRRDHHRHSQDKFPLLWSGSFVCLFVCCCCCLFWA